MIVVRHLLGPRWIRRQSHVEPFCWDCAVICILTYSWSRILIKSLCEEPNSFFFFTRLVTTRLPILKLVIASSLSFWSADFGHPVWLSRFLMRTYPYFFFPRWLMTIREKSQFHATCEWIVPDYTSFVNGACYPTTDLEFIGKFATILLEFGRKRLRANWFFTRSCVDKYPLVTKFCLFSLSWDVFHLNRKWSINELAVVREFFSTMFPQVYHFMILVITWDELSQYTSVTKTRIS